MIYIPSSAVIMILFTVLSSLSPDFLRSKPWLGVVSATATGMSLASGFGFLSYIGVVMTTSANMVPFLILGIGMDDTFIMLSAWLRTDLKKSIEDRMSETYRESGMSITITSLTNIGSFSAGYFFSNLPMLQNFCICMACCLTFDYIYQITFIGAFLVIFGRVEERRLHSVVFTPLKQTSSLGRKSIFTKIFCYVKPEHTNENEEESSFSVTNFWRKFSKWMTKSNIKIFIIFLYFSYLSITIWGLTKYFMDARLSNCMLQGTYRDNYYKLQEKYYHRYQYRLQLFIDQKLDYADPRVQVETENMIQHLESDPLIAQSDLTEWWLRSYLKFISDERNTFIHSEFNLTDPFDFLYVFRRYFLKIPLAKQFRHDIVFDKNYTSIVSCRFFLQTNITLDDNHFYRQLTSFKKKLDASPYSIILYHPLFYYFDVVDLMPKLCRQTFSVVFVTVFIISAILLPSMLTIICILFSIFSVFAGIMGLMFLWGIGLSLSSVSVFIMIIGICVDYAAHISCAYYSAKETDPNQRLFNAVSLTAMPILQGASTTSLALILCLLVPSNDVTTSIKIIFLACFIAAAHSILFLSVFISIFDSFCQKYFICKKNSQNNNLELVTEQIDTIGKAVDKTAM